MSKQNIQSTTRELKVQAQELLKRIKSMQDNVHKTLQGIRKAENTAQEEKKKQDDRLKKELDEKIKQERMTAYVMPDDLPENAEAKQHQHKEDQNSENAQISAADQKHNNKLENKVEIKIAENAEINAEATNNSNGESNSDQPKAFRDDARIRNQQRQQEQRPKEGDRPQRQQPKPQADADDSTGAQENNQSEIIYPFTSASGAKPQGTYIPGQRPMQQPNRDFRQGDRPQGGYQQRPQGTAGGYQQRPQGTAGGYQQRPQGTAGGYQQRPQGTAGGYQQRPGGFGANRAGGGFMDKDKDDSVQRSFQEKKRPAKPTVEGAPAVPKDKINFDPAAKKIHTTNYDNEKKVKNKKTAIKEAPPSIAFDDERMGSRKYKNKRSMQFKRGIEPIKIENIVITTENITVKILSEAIGKPASDIIKKLFMLGIMATINQEIDFDTVELIASEYGITCESRVELTAEETMQAEADEIDIVENLKKRPPVVTIMGHVDHGKTSLLDAIRQTNVTAGEAGGITQHIGAYTVEINGESITFLDTPGHEAFTSMRARGAQATDIAVLVVAADDGIMPQTIEAINHAKSANVPIIVAINKMDKPDANADKILQQLTEHSLLVEEWGGDVIAVQVSAKTKFNLDKLLEMILLVADVQELKANPERLAKGIIIEAKLDKGRGPVATVLVQNGTLKVGDTIVAGTAYGRVRAMIDDKGERVNEAFPSCPVEVLGFNEVPDSGDVLNAVDSDKFSRNIAEERKDKIKASKIQTMARVSLEDLFGQIAQGQIKDLNIIIKADVHGSVEAVKQSLEKLTNEQVRVRIIHGGVGAIIESDILLATVSNAIIIGFNVRPDSKAREAIEREKVDVRLYRVIYNAIQDVENAMKGMLDPEFKEIILGRCEVRNTFKVTGVGTIAGCYVQEGKVQRNAQLRVVRDSIVIHEGKIDSLKRFKDDAKEVASGYECGIGLENFNDVKDGDVFEVFVMEEIKR